LLRLRPAGDGSRTPGSGGNSEVLFRAPTRWRGAELFRGRIVGGCCGSTTDIGLLPEAGEARVTLHESLPVDERRLSRSSRPQAHGSGVGINC
jgi:hypothetical protein